MHIRKNTVASPPEEESKLPESALSICVGKTFFFSLFLRQGENRTFRFQSKTLGRATCKALLGLTYVIEPNPIAGVHLFFDVPEDNEVLGLPQRVFVHAGGQAGAALGSHQVCVAVGSLQGHVLGQGVLGCEALEVLWAQRIPHLWIPTPDEKQMFPG